MTGEELKQSRRLLFMLFVAWGVGFIDVQAVNIASSNSFLSSFISFDI